MEELNQNGFQNSGYFLQELIKNKEFNNLKPIAFKLYLWIVRHSVGYGQYFTYPISMDKLTDIFKCTKKTIYNGIHQLKEAELINIKTGSGFMKGGGSVADSYGPIMPKNFNIWIKDKNKNLDNEEEAKDLDLL